MNELMIVKGPSTKRMTSLEIAELVESRHDSVKRTIERIASVGSIELPPMVEVKNHLGQKISVFQLDKRSSLIVVAQLSPEFTARVVDRWQELEAQAATPAFQLPTSLPEALRLAADLAEQKMQLEATISAQAPKVEAFSRIAESDGLHNLTSTAKQMNIRPSTLTNYLSTNQWIYKRAGSKHWVAYQAKIEQGLLRHKTFSYGDSTGETWTREQVMVTPKGLTHLAEIFADKPQQHVTGFRGKNVSPSHINRGRPCLTR